VRRIGAEETGALVNWRQGLLRLWLAASAIWLASTRLTAKGPGLFSDWDVGLRAMLPEQFLVLAFAPPLAALVLGVAAVWIRAGFKRG
jgi:hypothetical protein